MVDIKLISKELKLKNPVLIEGFQGTGLVGTLAAQYIAKKLGMKQVGYMESDELPPLALMVEGEIKFPIRLFASERHNVLMVESELPIASKFASELADEIVRWAKKNKVSKIIALEGVSGHAESSSKVYGVATTEALDKELKTDGIQILKNGIIVGVSASLLLKCKMEKMPAICLMTESVGSFPDGKAAAAIIEYLSKKYKWDIDTHPLREEADKFEDEMKKIIEKAQSMQVEPKRTEKVIYG